jgi:nicotinamidase/pyrazinamidase
MRAAQTVDLKEGDALLVIDIQNCFLPGGSLGVAGGDEVVAPLNRAIMTFATRRLPVFVSRDWHPANHCSFVEQGGPWPPHCVQNTEGAAFAANLQIPEGAVVISKATDPEVEEYSDMAGRDPEGDTFDGLLRRGGVRRLFVGGLATDYCVLFTVRDALGLGYGVYLLTDGIRAVDVNPGDGEKAVREMEERGATLITTGMLTP